MPSIKNPAVLQAPAMTHKPRWAAISLYVLGVLVFGALAYYASQGQPRGFLWYIAIVPVAGAYVYHSLERDRGAKSAYHGKTRREIILDLCVMALVLGLIGMCWASVVRMTGE